MKKLIGLFILFLLSLKLTVSAREVTGSDAQKVIAGAEKIRFSDKSAIPEFVLFRQGAEIPFDNFQQWAKLHLAIPANSGFVLINVEKDKEGMSHYRYRQTLNGIPVEGSMFIVHVKSAFIKSMNGQLFDKIRVVSNTVIDKSIALNNALQSMNASLYRWQVPSWESHLKSVQNNPAATWFPKGELFYAPANGKYTSDNYRLCYKFDIYAQEPYDRQYVFVDAVTGAVIYKLNRIVETNVTGTAVTAYSGNQSFTTDSVNATTYRLRETTRGLGIETYNLQQGTTYLNTDFTDTDNNWNNFNAQLDEYATDAHWGAQMTYDFYLLNFNRNSLDNAGQKLLSYVHYDNNFVNAFWDGTSMTYGDGGNGYTPLTSLEITGHEISHGITENTCALVYADESGALNEGFSDCMGNAIRYYGKQPTSIDWFIGNEIGNTPFRNMANPNQFQNPDCYNGQYWNAPNEVHNNSGVLNFWFYLLTEGGAATNDLGNAYTVSALGIDTAAAILYRTWAVYLSPNSTYADARYYSIQSAADLYGACTNAVIQTTNAWHAVGVGNTFVAGVSSNFNAPLTSFCQAPSTVNFINTSNNGGSYLWDFGDGTTSTVTSPAHTYTAVGTYTVQLIADGGSCGIDSITKINYIDIDETNPCIIILSNGTNQTQTSCAGQLFDTGGPAASYADNTNSTITIAPTGASTVTLTFTLFEMEDTYDFLYVYDGPTAASPLIGAYTAFTLPNGGTITSSGSSITLVQTSDVSITNAGFAINWLCVLSNVAPAANFVADITSSCNGTVNFTDLSTNGPTSWLWDFGDATSSTLQSPSHTYTTNGVYTVALTATNSFGANTYTINSYISINLPVDPAAADVTICPGTQANISAIGTDSLMWYTLPVGGLSVYTGAFYTTPVLTATTTYYVESAIYPSTQKLGPIDSTFGTGNNYNNNTYRFLSFDCFSPVKLVSVKVYAVGAGNRTITLIDNAGTILNSLTVNIPDGPSRLTLNFDIPAGTNFELGMPGNANLFRNNSGAVFPYSVAGLVSITGTNSGAPGYYYYFYDWEIQAPPCTSNRIPVTVNVTPTQADFSYTSVLETYTFTDISVGAVSWLWDFGDGGSSVLQNPVHTYMANGTYMVMLIISDGTCTDTTLQTVTITTVGLSNVGGQSSISVYPNPANDVLFIDFGSIASKQLCTIKLNNAIGQTIVSKQVSGNVLKTTYAFDISNVAAGVYEIVISSDQKSFIQKVVIE
ncbi:MAG: M4 family metallopeptidase [Bacteroidetes bacterium]|nr:M4 family metallopeptidase [Bacteroidota bacterium]